MSKLVIILVLAALLAVFSYLLVLPRYHDLQALNSQVEDKQKELSRKEEYFNQLTALNEELKNYEGEIAKIDYAFPEHSDISEVLVFLEQAASSNGLVIEEIGIATQPKSPPPLGINQKIRERGLTVFFSGNVESLRNFLTEIEQSARLLQVNSIFFEHIEEDPGTTEGIFSFEISFVVRSWSEELMAGEEAPSLPVLEPRETSIDFDFLSSPEMQALKTQEQIPLPEEKGRENPFISY